jgi:hypothetical protein
LRLHVAARHEEQRTMLAEAVAETAPLAAQPLRLRKAVLPKGETIVY